MTDYIQLPIDGPVTEAAPVSIDTGVPDGIPSVPIEEEAPNGDEPQDPSAR